MTVEKRREAVRAKPFRPINIFLADGREIRVPRPECILLSLEAQRMIFVAGAGETTRIINLLLVTSVDFVNGRKRRSGA